MPERLVIIGGDAAGMSAASEARRRRPADDLEIVVFERSSYVSYSACGEPYFVGDYVTEVDELIARTPEQFAAREIEVHTRHEVTAIDTEARRVVVRPVDGGAERSEPYDQLLVATGAEPNRPPIDGAHLAGGPGPIEENQDDADQHQGRTPLKQRRHQDEDWQRWHDDEDIRQQGNCSVGDATDEAGCETGKDAN